MKSLIVALAMITSVAHAAEQTKVNFDQPIKSLEGKAFILCEEADKDRKCTKELDLTLEKMALQVLQQPEQGLSGTELTRRAYLALRIYEVKTLGLSADDIKLIKDLIAKGTYNPVAVYRAYDLLDGSVPK